MKFLKTQKIVLLAIMFALMIVFLIYLPMNAYVPLICLIVISQTGDIKLAALGGLLFGLASLMSAAFFPSTPLYPVFLNPLVSIIPRIITGIVIYLVYKGAFKLLRKQKYEIKSTDDVYTVLTGEARTYAKKIDYISMTVAAVFGALTNTVLVLGTMFLLYNGRTFSMDEASILVKPEVIIPLVLISAITEPIVSGIVAPPIVTAIKHIR